MNSVAHIEDIVYGAGERIQTALVGFSPTAWPLSRKNRRHGILVVTNNWVGFFPVDRLGTARPIPYVEIISVKVRSFLGHRTATFHTDGGPLAVRCLASRKDLADLFEYVNNRIAVDAGKEKLAAGHALIKLKIGTGDVADDRWDDQYEEALRLLFQDAEHQEPEMVRASARARSELAELSPDGCKEQTEAFGHIKSLSAKGRDYGAATQAMFRAGQGRSSKQAAHATVKGGAKTPSDRRVVFPLLAFMVVELWWLYGMLADTVAWPMQAQQQQTERPQPIVPRMPETNRNTPSNWAPQEISRPDNCYSRH